MGVATLPGERPAAGGPGWVTVLGDVAPLGRPRSHPVLRSVLAGSDVCVANLETALTVRGHPAEKAVTQRADPARAADVRELGIDVVTLANNHTMDFGPTGMADTVEALRDIGVAAVGAGPDDTSALTCHVRDTDRGRVAVLGISACLPPGAAAAPGRPGIAPVRVLQQVALDPVLAAEQPGMAPYVHTRVHPPDLDAVCAAVRSARAHADLVVVAVHWGVPHGFAAPSYGAVAEYQPVLGRALVDAGADVVAGHHPHRVDALEVYRGGLIAYSLGNVMFHDWERFVPDRQPAPDADGSAGSAEVFPSATPVAPYRSAFGDDVTAESVVLVVTGPRVAGRLPCRLLPTVMVDGDPVPAPPDRARTVLARLVDPHTRPAGARTPDLHTRVDPDTGWLHGEAHSDPLD